MDTGGESQVRFIRPRKQPNAKHELFMLLGMGKEREMPKGKVIAGALESLVDEGRDTGMGLLEKAIELWKAGSEEFVN